jgi:hypothetical protein
MASQPYIRFKKGDPEDDEVIVIQDGDVIDTIYEEDFDPTKYGVPLMVGAVSTKDLLANYADICFLPQKGTLRIVEA